MNILLVGAGAVGQVYGLHLQHGGAKVGFLVRPSAREACERGFTLYALDRQSPSRPIAFRPDHLFSSVREASAVRWDQVWLCVPTTAVTDELLRDVATVAGEAVIVALPPGAEAEARIRAVFPDERVVPGFIGLISYQAPLPGESMPVPGMAFHFPPLTPSLFDGRQATAVVDALRRGGCPAEVSPRAALQGHLGSCVLMPNVAGLELSGWSIAALRDGPLLSLVARASQQALTATSRRLSISRPLYTSLLHPLALRVAWTVAPRLTPFPLETYLHHHFAKVGAQTRQMLAQFQQDADAHGVPSDALVELATALRADAPARGVER